MRSYSTTARDRGVTTIPVDPEAAAPIVAAALLAEHSPVPTLMRRLLSGDIPQRVDSGDHRRAGCPTPVPAFTEAQMIALGTPAETPVRRRGRR